MEEAPARCFDANGRQSSAELSLSLLAAYTLYARDIETFLQYSLCMRTDSECFDKNRLPIEVDAFQRGHRLMTDRHSMKCSFIEWATVLFEEVPRADGKTRDDLSIMILVQKVDLCHGLHSCSTFGSVLLYWE